MRYYLDTEFDEKHAVLISIGVVSQDGRQFYAVNTDYDWSCASQWLIDNVQPLLMLDFVSTIKGSAAEICDALVAFVGHDFKTEFWGYKCAWDIVLVHRMFGGYNEISANQHPIPLVCHDLYQLGRSVGITSIKEKVKPFEPAHNSLVDARWTKFVHEMFIMQYGRSV